MDYFKTVYRILSFLAKAEENDEFDRKHFTPEHFNLSSKQWAATLERLIDDGNVKGVEIDRAADGYAMISLPQPRLTTKGFEYLHENALMREAEKQATGTN